MRTDAEPGSEPLSAHERRRLALASLLRSSLVSTAIIVGYFVLPLTSPLATDSILVFIAALAVVAALLGWQVREIIRSPYPGAKAIGALMVSVPLFWTVFATTYYLMGSAEPGSFSEPLTRLDAAYFTVTVFATVGFGDVVAVSQTARAVALLQMVLGIILVGLIARVIVSAVQEARGQRAGHPQ